MHFEDSSTQFWGQFPAISGQLHAITQDSSLQFQASQNGRGSFLLAFPLCGNSKTEVLRVAMEGTALGEGNVISR